MSGSLSKQRLQRGLVVVQIAVSVVLLAGAGLLTRTMIRLSDVDTGLRTEEVLTMEVPLLQLSGGQRRIRPPRVPTSWRWTPRPRSATSACGARSRRFPGVIEVGVGSPMPLAHLDDRASRSRRKARPLAVGEAMPRAELRTAEPRVLPRGGDSAAPRARVRHDRSGRLRAGRDHQPDARRPASSPARTRSGSGSRGRATCCEFTPISGDWRTIVGVVGNTQDGGLDAEPRAGGVHAVRADVGDRRRAGDPRRQQRRGSGGGGDAHRAAHRADGADRERADAGADQGSERRAAAPERRAGLVVRHPGGDHRRGGDRRRAGVLGERAHQRDRHPHEPRRRPRLGCSG